MKHQKKPRSVPDYKSGVKYEVQMLVRSIVHKKTLTEYCGFTLEHGHIDIILDENIRKAIIKRDRVTTR